MIIRGTDYSGSCPCGHSHAMQTKLAVIEAGCLKDFNHYMAQAELCGITTAVYDENTYAAQGLARPQTHHSVILPAAGLHANEAGVDALKVRLPRDTQILVAVGSGTVHDITRYVAWELGVPFVSCPTAASVDGFCSSVAAMTWGGAKRTLTAVPPRLVLADLDVITRAPMRLTRSGFGDMIGKYIALTDWRIGHILTGEHYCQRIADLTEEATAAVLESADGILAGDPDAYEKLTAGLILSGLAMQMLGTSRPASGAEHHISHLIEMEPPALGTHSEALHGEKVGVGTLLMAECYHMLSTLPAANWQDYQPYTEAEVQSVFGPALGGQILKENEKDPCLGICSAYIQEKLPLIRAEIDKIPRPEVLSTLYSKLGMCACLEDISVDAAHREHLLHWAPMVRCRLSFLRLMRCVR